MKIRRFTKTELARYDGKNGARALFAWKGKIYDVSGSFQWQNGVHQVLHAAGTDLSTGLDQAPHGADLLQKFPVVGELVEG